MTKKELSELIYDTWNANDFQRQNDGEAVAVAVAAALGVELDAELPGRLEFYDKSMWKEVSYARNTENSELICEAIELRHNPILAAMVEAYNEKYGEK